MLFNLIRTCRGKDEVIMTDSRTKVNDKLKTLRQSHRGQHSGMGGRAKVSFRIENSEETKKFIYNPHNPHLAG